MLNHSLINMNVYPSFLLHTDISSDEWFKQKNNHGWSFGSQTVGQQTDARNSSKREIQGGGNSLSYEDNE